MRDHDELTVLLQLGEDLQKAPQVRVVECRLAALVIARKIGIATTMEEMAKISTLRNISCFSALLKKRPSKTFRLN